MTDKQKIRNKLERLKEETSIGLSEHENGVEQGRMEIINALSLFLDSLQEEPVSNPVDFEKELYKAFGQVKDFTLCMRIAKWFYDMGKNSQEPVELKEVDSMIHTIIAECCDWLAMNTNLSHDKIEGCRNLMLTVKEEQFKAQKGEEV